MSRKKKNRRSPLGNDPFQRGAKPATPAPAPAPVSASAPEPVAAPAPVPPPAPEVQAKPQPQPQAQLTGAGAVRAEDLPAQLEQLERTRLVAAMAKHRGRKSDVARELGIWIERGYDVIALVPSCAQYEGSAWGKLVVAVIAEVAPSSPPSPRCSHLSSSYGSRLSWLCISH